VVVVVVVVVVVKRKDVFERGNNTQSRPFKCDRYGRVSSVLFFESVVCFRDFARNAALFASLFRTALYRSFIVNLYCLARNADGPRSQCRWISHRLRDFPRNADGSRLQCRWISLAMPMDLARNADGPRAGCETSLAMPMDLARNADGPRTDCETSLAMPMDLAPVARPRLTGWVLLLRLPG
jgi:hypothetical protein